MTVKAVRYSSDKGIICPQNNLKTGYRDFSEDDVAKLQFVGKARKCGFSTQACRDLLALYQDKNGSSKEVKLLPLAKITEKDKKLDELEGLR